MSEKGKDVDLTRAKQNTGVWLVKVGDLSVRSCFWVSGLTLRYTNSRILNYGT